jgi:hypothetical protein
MRKFSLISLIFILVAFGCTHNISFDHGISGAKHYQSAGKPWSITHEKKIVRRGNGSVRFELRPNDTWRDAFKDSHRTEMRFPESGSGWYGFSLMIPDDGSYFGRKPYIGQWHYAGAGSFLRHKSLSPVIGQIFEESDRMLIRVCHDKGAKTFTIHDFKRGMWHDMIYQIKFSHKENGFINVWSNGKQILKYKGPTCYRGSDIFFKFGIYTRSDLKFSETDKPAIVYFDEYSLGGSYEEVDPSKGSHNKIDSPPDMIAFDFSTEVPQSWTTK